jgi:hypothetical protein
MNRLGETYRSVLIVCIAASLAGCYTLLKHPTTDDGYEHGDFSRCAQCHDGYYHISPLEPYYEDAWWDYYILPWWYDEIIVVSDDEEAPIRRAIHGMRDIQRDGWTSGGIGVDRSPPASSIKAKKDVVDTQTDEAGDETPKKRKKEVTNPSRSGTRERGGGGRDEGSSGNDTKQKEKSGADKGRDKKRKR